MDDDQIKKLQDRLEERTRELIKRSVELDEAKAKGESVLESMADGVVVTGKDRNIILMNTAGKKLLGWTDEELLGKKWPEIVEAVDGRSVKIPVDAMPSYQVVATGKVVSTGTQEEIHFTKKNRERIPVAITASPVRVRGASRGVVVVFRDIAREKEIEKIHSDFISVASHQLRTPLTGIQWVIERLVKTEEFTEKGKAYLADIHDTMRRLSRLVDDLLNVSRIEGGNISIIVEPFDVIALIGEYIREIRSLADEKRLILTFDKRPESLHVESDRNMVRNIIQSIVSNAVYYTSAGGSVDIVVEKKEKTFLIRVSDTGIGIPKNEQGSIFTKFTRGTNAKLIKTDGTGLGLYIANEAARFLGGSVRFESEENRGTVFYVELPVHSEALAKITHLA